MVNQPYLSHYCAFWGNDLIKVENACSNLLGKEDRDFLQLIGIPSLLYIYDFSFDARLIFSKEREIRKERYFSLCHENLFDTYVRAGSGGIFLLIDDLDETEYCCSNLSSFFMMATKIYEMNAMIFQGDLDKDLYECDLKIDTSEATKLVEKARNDLLQIDSTIVTSYENIWLRQVDISF